MGNTHAFRANQLVSGYEGRTIIQGIDIEIPKNKISVIIGSNGCGKSTLLKTMAKLIKPTEGNVTLDGKAINKYPPKQLARMLGLLPQSPIVPDGITVADLVGRGRFPHQSLFGGWSNKDYKAVQEAMEFMKIEEFANDDIDELSGGQRQRVWIAMALAQQTDILLLDEPTTFLDITYQVEILDLLTNLNRTYGTTIVMVLHDINLSARYADHIFAVKDGQLVEEGDPSKVITSDLVKLVFDLESVIIPDPISNTPLVIPKGQYHIVD